MNNLISVILPVYNEEGNIPVLVERLTHVLNHEKIEYEIIFVDDGSKDKTFKIIREAAKKDARVFGLRFRRNHGQTIAIKAGIEHAKGDICITLDGDLQHEPEDIPRFLNKINEGYDLVCSYRSERNDSFIRKFPSKIANMIARKFSKLELKDFGSTYRVYCTQVAKEMLIYGEMHRFIPIFANMFTDRITEIPITLQPRIHGQSKYGLGRTFRVLSDLLIVLFFSRFFNRPMHVFGYISLALGLPGLTILTWLAVGKIFGLIAIMNYAPIFILGVILCIVSVQTMSTGIICEYLIRIYYNNKRKPYSICETTIGKINEI
jgi:glycosyltransferase involved in cell wall biosynthesis